MKPIFLVPVVLLLPTACGRPAEFEPECVASGRTHSCVDAMPHSCTLMGVYSGLDVAFEAPVEVAYQVDFSWDGQAESFGCEPESVDGETRWSIVGETPFVWMCDGEGFFNGPTADEIEITVTVEGSAPVTTTVTPCWDISEPNGRCCGFAYSASATVPAL